MQQKSVITDEIDFLVNLGQLARVYESISTIKMQQIRESIIQSRAFVLSLLDIFKSLRFQELEDTELDISQLDKYRGLGLKPLATVLITANAKFHGDILRKIFMHFISQYDHKGELFIIGKIGRDLTREYEEKISFKEFDISDINFTIQDLKPILFHLLQYKKIRVYYAVYKNLVDQTPTETDITDILTLTPEELKKETTENERPEFLFEPSGQEIAGYIHNSVIAMLLLQTVSETHLARLASRLNAMEALLTRVDTNVKTLRFRERRIVRSINDGKQQERLAGFSMW